MDIAHARTLEPGKYSHCTSCSRFIPCCCSTGRLGTSSGCGTCVRSPQWRRPSRRCGALWSFDGVSLHLPPESTRRGWYKGNDWFHTDANFRSKERVVQAFVSLTESRPCDATFTSTLQAARAAARCKNPKKTGIDCTTRSAAPSLRAARQSAWPSPRAAWSSGTAAPFTAEPSPCPTNVCMVPREEARARFRGAPPHKPPAPRVQRPHTYGKPVPDVAPVAPPNLAPAGAALV